MLSKSKKILFFPLSNVLGHLTRTLALAEEFDAQGHEVYIATNGTYSFATRALPPGIRVIPTPEMHATVLQSFGLIQHYEETTANDRENLNNCGRIDKSELQRRRHHMSLMVERDTAIVEEVCPDAIIADYRFTSHLFQQRPLQQVFYISHILGYPSLYRRVLGDFFPPLNAAHILVPGIRNIEYWGGMPAIPPPQRRESMCGMFRWAGWRRLHPDAPKPPASDVFLFFGSTGSGGQIVPWLLRSIPEQYRISSIAPELTDAEIRSGVHVSKRGELERFLGEADVVFCHGGHGTVMECILHRTPMAIFPHNIEQLEIGRRIEKMRLGVLVKRPYDQLSGGELGQLIENMRSDPRMRDNLEKYSKLLRRQDGPKQAVSTVLRSIAE